MVTRTDVRSHYVGTWGAPSSIARFDLEGRQVDVQKWEASTTTEGVAIYATIGASDMPMREADPLHRVEFVVGQLPANDDVALPLAVLASYPSRLGAVVVPGEAVTLKERLWPGTQMRSFLVMNQVGELIAPLELDDGGHVGFLQAIPVHESEVSFKTQHGVDALLERWQQLRHPFWDPNRHAEPDADPPGT